MNEMEIKSLVKRQRAFFAAGSTLDVNKRLLALKRLKACIVKYEREIGEALKADLGKSSTESYMCETGLVLNEITYMEKHIRKFAKEKTVPTPLAQFHSRSYKKPSPYGVVLIMSPWNYPFLLTFEPLVDAVAAGNTVIVKPGAYSSAASGLIKKIVEECFPKAYVAVVTGGREENACLLKQHFDFIFFTGSQKVGKEVMRCAAKWPTPVTLELGGKSPCVVERTANLKLAAKRIVFGKYLNCGQTCVAPDYIFCDKAVAKELTEEIKKQIRAQFGKEPLKNKNYGRIINEKHWKRLLLLMEPEKICVGGACDADTLQIEPTVMTGVSFEDPVMQEEIFGPILPILTFEDFDGAVKKLRSMPHPLALYIFTSDRAAADRILSRCSFGGGCVNDTIIHLATSEMGFGGFGESGMGAYHGKDGFDTFSHYKSIVDKKTWLDLPIRYQPYRWICSRLIRMFLR